MNPRLYSIYLKLLLVYILQEDMEALGQNIIEVFKGFTSQEGLEIFITNKFYTCKVSREEILLREGKFSWSHSRSCHMHNDDYLIYYQVIFLIVTKWGLQWEF